MNFLFNLFSGKKNNIIIKNNFKNKKIDNSIDELGVEKKLIPENSSGISYDPSLIDKLKTDHQDLLKIHAKIKKASDNGDFRAIFKYLCDLKFGFQTHLMVENVKFYAYMQKNFPHDEGIASFVSDVKKEMNGISRDLVKFINKYTALNYLNAETLVQFREEFSAIGIILTKRIQMEENELYTLYKGKH